MEGLKSNTSEGVKIRIAKLKKTLDEIANKQTKQSVEERNYDINPIGITSDVADFLNGYGVNISIKDGQMVFEEDRGLELDLSERAIRFTNKITHLLHETTNPKPVIDSVLSLYSSVKDTEIIPRLMDHLSDAISADKDNNYEIITEVIKDSFPRIIEVVESLAEKASHGKNKKQVAKKMFNLHVGYEAALKEYLITVLNNLGKNGDMSKIMATESYMFAKFINLDKPSDHIISIEKVTSYANIDKKHSADSFEHDFGIVIGVQCSETSNISNNKVVTLHTNKDGKENVYAIGFGKKVTPKQNDFIKKLTTNAFERESLGHSSLFRNTIRSMDSIVKHDYLLN